MDKKEEQTFADIFSNSTKEIEKKEQTFSNILKNESTKTEQSNDSSENKVTFDNIFEQMATQENRKEDPNLSKDGTKELLPKNEKLENIITSQEKEKKDTDHSKKFNPFPTNSEERKIDTNKIEEEKENPFFQNISLSVLSPNTTDETLNIESSPSDNHNTFNPLFSNNITPIKEQTGNNPFLNLSDDNRQGKEESIKNPFFNKNSELSKENNSIEEETKSKNTKEEINPFFSNNQKENAVPFIELPTFKKNKDQTTISPEENPFFKSQENIEKEVSNNTDIELASREKMLEDKENKLPEKEESLNFPKSTSPFFEENFPKIEENPLFQGQINLIENKIPDTPKTNIDITKSKHYDVKIVKKKEPLIKFILGVISYAIFIFLLLIGITLLIYVLDIKIRAAKGDYSSPTYNAYVVLTGSMLPEIQVYDVVVTKKIEPSKLNEGDVITFASADSRFLGTIITHRIMKKNYDAEKNSYTFQTKGDNNNVADTALVPASNIYGKVILKIPKLGYLQEFLASDGGWIIVILIPCLTVISYDIVKLVKGLKRKKYKNIKVQK